MAAGRPKWADLQEAQPAQQAVPFQPFEVEDSRKGPQEGPPSGDKARCPRWVYIIGVAIAIIATPVVVTLLVLGGNAGTAPPVLPSVNLLVIGDFGMEGDYRGTDHPPRKPNPLARTAAENQLALVQQLSKVAKEREVSAVIAVGGSFYPDGLQSVDDELFDISWSNVYGQGKSSELKDIPWYAVLGDREYMSEDVAVHLDPQLTARDKRWNARISGSVSFGEREKFKGAPLIEVVFFDTTPFIEDFLERPKDKTPFRWTMQRARGASPEDPKSWRAELQRQLTELDATLMEARTKKARWILVFGNAPIRSLGDRPDFPELVALLDPILWDNGVNAYFNGHSPNMEHDAWADCCIFRAVKQYGESKVGKVFVNEVSWQEGWVELYSNEDRKSINLAGYKISTNEGGEVILGQGSCDHVIPKMGFLELNEQSQGECGRVPRLQVNDFVRLTDPKGQVVSELRYGMWEGTAGYTFGRYGDGFGNAGAMRPTPGLPNSRILDPVSTSPPGAPLTFNRSGLLCGAPPRPAKKDKQRMHYFTFGNGGRVGNVQDPFVRFEYGSNKRYFSTTPGFGTIYANELELTVEMRNKENQVVHRLTLGNL